MDPNASVYDMDLFSFGDWTAECYEFLNQDCQMSGDCFLMNTATGETHNALGAQGVYEAEDGQCDEHWDTMTDVNGDQFFIDESDGTMKMYMSANRLVATALVAFTTSLTLY